MVWACVAKEDTDWVKKCTEYEVTKRQTKKDVERDYAERFEQGGCYGLWQMEEADKDWMIRMVGE